MQTNDSLENRSRPRQQPPRHAPCSVRDAPWPMSAHPAVQKWRKPCSRALFRRSARRPGGAWHHADDHVLQRSRHLPCRAVPCRACTPETVSARTSRRRRRTLRVRAPGASQTPNMRGMASPCGHRLLGYRPAGRHNSGGTCLECVRV